MYVCATNATESKQSLPTDSYMVTITLTVFITMQH